MLIVLAFIYGYLENYQRAFTGSTQADGVIGVILGLFICSRPAANFLGALYRSSSDYGAAASVLPGWLWPLLNVLTLCAGMITVILGAMQFVRGAPIR
jgi:hypothetical protein